MIPGQLSPKMTNPIRKRKENVVDSRYKNEEENLISRKL